MQNIDCEYLLELPWWDGSNEYHQNIFFLAKWKENNLYPYFTI